LLDRNRADSRKKSDKTMITPTLPITLASAAILAVLGLILALRASMARGKHGILMGDGGNAELLVRMRSHANFVEYAPLTLIMMALLELAGANRVVLIVSAAVFILARILHAVGMARGGANPFRMLGAVGSALVVLLYAGYGLIVAFLLR
jgi:uncharacterized membrane protein YecN with MAPEG domain